MGTGGEKSVNIGIDEYTPCLIDRQTGKILETTTEKIVPKKGEFSEWKFDWTLPCKKGFDVFSLKTKGKKETQGLISTRFEKRNSAVYINTIETAPHNFGKNGKYKGVGAHLFAFACKQAHEKGVDGAIWR